jgi:hypothetical protein
MNRKCNVPRKIANLAKAGMSAIVALAILAGAMMGTESAVAQYPAAIQSANDKAYFVTGGIGLEERARLSQEEKTANLKLVFTEPLGSYVSDIAVTVTDRKGNVVLETNSAGPWLIARLEPGSYKVVAQDNYMRQVRMVNLGRGLRKLHFHMTEQAGLPGRPNS